MSEEKVIVKVQMSNKAIKQIEHLKNKMNASTQAEVLRYAISLLTAVEEARNSSGNVVIPSKSAIPGRDKKIILPWN